MPPLVVFAVAQPPVNRAEHVAIVAPHEHFAPIDLPSMDAVEWMEVPSRLIRVLGSVRDVIRAVLFFHHDLAMALQLVGAQKELVAGGKNDVAVLQQATERDILRVGKWRAMGPAPRIVLG